MPRDVVGYALLGLLALQYGTQPFLTSRYLSQAGCDSRAVVLITELAKAALCACSLGLQRSPAGGARRRTARDVLQTAAPAACYLVQNLAMQRAYADLDSLTFNCLNQTKLVATAFFLFVLLRQRQSGQQLVALAMLLLAGVLLQLTGEQRAASSAGAAVKNFRRGVAVRFAVRATRGRKPAADVSARSQACLLASALSGLASTLTQISLQVRRRVAASGVHCALKRLSGRALPEQQRSKSSAAFTLEMVRLHSGGLRCLLTRQHPPVAPYRPGPAHGDGIFSRRAFTGLGACASRVRVESCDPDAALTGSAATRLDGGFIRARVVAGVGRHHRRAGYETAGRHQQGVRGCRRAGHHGCAAERAGAAGAEPRALRGAAAGCREHLAARPA